MNVRCSPLFHVPFMESPVPGQHAWFTVMQERATRLIARALQEEVIKVSYAEDQLHCITAEGHLRIVYIAAARKCLYTYDAGLNSYMETL